jgi:pimeloyl-ACP methyl ester carboxylesterase
MACDPDGTQDSGAIYRICMPTLMPWNGELIVYAHGYVSPTEPVGFPEDQMGLPGGPQLSTILTTAGYAFAATSYSTNGLAVQEGLADLVDLVGIFTRTKGTPQVVYLAGVSEGGLITALAAEQHAETFDGGLAMCGPVGDFAYQVDHVGDFRAVFDYFFPGLVPGDAIEIPHWLIDGWDDHYVTQIQPVIADPSKSEKVVQLLRVTGTGDETLDQETRKATIEQLLWFNVMGTNDAVAKLAGQPFDNRTRVYSGSDDDVALNAAVARFGADEDALETMVDDYGASGRLAMPLVTLHTALDPLVPHGHVPIYQAKVAISGSRSLYEHRDAEAYGHCAFSEDDVWDAFLLLEEMVKNPSPPELTERVYVPLAVWR